MRVTVGWVYRAGVWNAMIIVFLCVGHVWPVIVRADRVVSLRENKFGF